jgi:hypothetical protein
MGSTTIFPLPWAGKSAQAGFQVPPVLAQAMQRRTGNCSTIPDSPFSTPNEFVPKNLSSVRAAMQGCMKPTAGHNTERPRDARNDADHGGYRA